MPEFNKKFRFRNLPDESTPKSAENLNVSLENLCAICGDTAGAHNAIFRGEDVTKYLDDESLWERISSGTFDDLFIGDYILKNNVKYRIAGFDYYLNKGNTTLKSHHAVIVPDMNLAQGKMYETNEITGGYSKSYMVTTVLPQVLTTIEGVFGSTYVLEYTNSLTNGINEIRYNRFGQNTGAASGNEWVARKLDLMSEVQVFGSTIWSSSGYDTGSMNTQLPLFKLAPEFIPNRNWYWLRDIVSASRFAISDGFGSASSNNASTSGGVRPFFFIG